VDHFSPAKAPYQAEHSKHLITLKAALLFPILPVFFCLLTCFRRHFRLSCGSQIWKTKLRYLSLCWGLADSKGTAAATAFNGKE